MVILSKATINAYCKIEPRSAKALLNWYYQCKGADWSGFAEMKKTFNSVDAVGNERFVFNIKGNDYRLVARITFKIRTIYILFIGTHIEYDKIDASKISRRT